MIGFHGIGNSHMFEDEEMGNYHPEIENGDSNGDNETGIIGALGNKLEKTFKNSLSAMKSEHAEKAHSNAAVADEEVSIQGKILANLMGHITNDLAIGKKIKSGSAHEDAALELWYDKAVAAGNDVETYRNYEITYYRPEKEPETSEEREKYIRWEDNRGNSGYKVKNTFHNQCYFPEWIKEDKITFKGTCLPQNAVDESGQGNYFVLYKFRYGYADNEVNTKDESAIDIDWAVNSKGQKVHLPGIDFIKIYTGVNQENGWLGECSTEISGVEDLHVLGVDIDTRK